MNDHQIKEALIEHLCDWIGYGPYSINGKMKGGILFCTFEDKHRQQFSAIVSDEKVKIYARCY